MNKLLILGDSIMKGVVYSDERHRHTMLPTAQRPLNELMEAHGVGVENHARFGATASVVLRETEKNLREPEPDTTVLFGFGGNDSDYDWAAIAQEPEGSYRPKTLPEELEEIYRGCIRQARRCRCRVLAVNLVPIDAEKYFRWISQGKNGENILRWLGDVSMLYRWHENYNDRITGVCRSENVPVVDLRQPFLLSHRFSGLIGFDGIHPTAEGYSLADGVIARSVLA